MPQDLATDPLGLHPNGSIEKKLPVACLGLTSQFHLSFFTDPVKADMLC